MAQTVADPAADGWKQHSIGGFSDLVGPFWARGEEYESNYGFIVEERHLNGHGVAHGGMLMTFLDQAIGRMVWESIDRGRCATIQLSTQFIDAGRLGEFIEARPVITRKTRSVVFTRGTLHAAGRLIASAEGIWKIQRAGADTPALAPG